MAHPSSYRPAPGSIPTQPGVYRFLDARGTVLYVGKAKNLRNRLNNYFADPARLHWRTATMVNTAAKVEWTVVQNELESLQLEYTWIQEFDPRFNVKYRDDKSYPWLCITWSDEFPRVYVGRGKKRRGYRYYGPFAQAWAIRETVDVLLRVFPMRSCSPGVFRAAKSSGRPCLLAHIGKCSAPCVDWISPEDHRELVEDFSSFMSGRVGQLERRLVERMQLASQDLEFEQAAKIRDDLQALRSVSEKNAIVLPDGTDADVVAVAQEPLELAVEVFHVRGGRVVGQRGQVADRADDSTIAELLQTFLMQLYGTGEQGDEADIPSEILVGELPEDAEVLAEALTLRKGSRVRIRVPQRGQKVTLLETVGRNATEALQQHKLRRAGDLTTRTRALEEIQQALMLPEPPLRIECYDISHLQGTEVVASMVVFEDGMARKSEYRRFIIKSFEGSNDVRAMHEVITRRLRRLQDDQESLSPDAVDGPALVDPTTGAARKFAYRPSLIVVDGGAPQVAAAQQAMDDLGITDIALCGLAKRLEELWVPDDDMPVIMPRTSEGLYLLQRVRDEAHRFAITHHRGRRSKSMLESGLDAVPGLGEVRRKALIAQFGSLKKLRAADADQIAQVPGFGPTLAQAVVRALAEQQPSAPAVNMATGEILD